MTTPDSLRDTLAHALLGTPNVSVYGVGDDEENALTAADFMLREYDWPWPGAGGPAEQRIAIPIFAAQDIPADHWLNEPRFAWFCEVWFYAATQTRAIPAMAKCSAPELYHFVWTALHHMKLDPELRGSLPGGSPTRERE